MKPRKTNKHHLLFPRTSWNHGSLGKLRNLFTQEMTIGQHNYLHKRISCIPALNEYLAMKVLSQLPHRPHINDLIRTLDRLANTEHDDITKELLELTKKALIKQKTYL